MFYLFNNPQDSLLEVGELYQFDGKCSRQLCYNLFHYTKNVELLNHQKFGYNADGWFTQEPLTVTFNNMLHYAFPGVIKSGGGRYVMDDKNVLVPIGGLLVCLNDTPVAVMSRTGDSIIGSGFGFLCKNQIIVAMRK